MEAQGMAGHLIRRLHQISTQVFTKQIKQAGLDLTQVQFAALDAIHANPGIDQARVAALIAYDRATIGGVIDRLEQKALVARRISPRDRRAREVSLTEDGEMVFQTMLPIVQALQADLLSELTQAQRDTFLTLARKACGAVTD